MKWKWLAAGIILLFVGTFFIPAIAQEIEKPLASSRGNWLYVGGNGPGNYTTIQSAIDDANPGDTVYVYSGTYPEKLVINKTIDVIGEERDTTVIDGGGTTYVVSISSDGVMISGFTVQNGLCGIYLRSSNNITIMGNNASHTHGIGISLYYSNNSIIEGNNVHSNTGYGIYLDYSNDNTLKGNNIHSNTDYGIFLYYSNNNNIEGNNVHSNNIYGLFIYYSNINIIEGNIYSNNEAGIVLFSCSNNNIFYHNNLINNSQNALDEGSNIWDNGYPSGGNYWSDYTGIDNDGDGIGDTSYDVPGGSNQDRYPFIKPNGWLNQPPYTPIIEQHGNLLCINATDPDGDKMDYYWSFGDGTYSGWMGPFESGHTLCVSHEYFGPGTYEVKVKLRDEHGLESTWSEPYNYTVYESKETFLVGLITDFNDSGLGFFSFKAKLVWFARFNPFSFGRVIPNEEIIVLRDYQGYGGPGFIIGIFDVVE